MSNNTSNSLVYWSGSLLIVPVTASQSTPYLMIIWTSLSRLLKSFAVEVVSFQYNFGIVHLWERNANNYDHPGSIVRKIKTFTHSAPTNTHKQRSFLIIFIYCTVKPIQCQLVLICFVRFFQNYFVFQYLPQAALFGPTVISIIHKLVRREENQHPTRHSRGKFSNCLRKIVNHFMVISALKVKFELWTSYSSPQNADINLVGVYHMRVF